MSPDSVIVEYFSRREEGARAFDVVDSTGRRYNKRCRKCHRSVRHQKGSGEWVCGHCGEDWPYYDRYMMKGQVSTSPRTDVVDEQMAALADIGLQLDRFLSDPRWKWAGRAYVSSVLGFDLPDIVRAMRVAWAGAPVMGINEVYREIGRARLEWGNRLSQVGIL